MSKYEPLCGETANGSINQLWFLRSYHPTWITVVILELIHALKPRLSREGVLLLDQNQSSVVKKPMYHLVTLNNFSPIARL